MKYGVKKTLRLTKFSNGEALNEANKNKPYELNFVSLLPQNS
jgi:hypothetical protein